MLQQTVARVLEAFPADKIWTVTNEEHAFEVRKQVSEIDPDLESRVVAEPVSRNTLPAIMLGQDKVVGPNTQALAAVFPSDHLISNGTEWNLALEKASALAAQRRFVTFGVEPDHPETGCGYITLGESLGDDAFAVDGFVEKPDLDTAKSFVRDGNHLWNSGMFLFRVKDFLKQVARCQPRLWDWWLAREKNR